MRFADDPMPDAGLVALVTEGEASLDALDDDGRTLGDVRPPAVRPVGSARVEAEEIRAVVGLVLGGLPPRQRAILTLRWGWDRAHPATFDEIARALGISRQRAHQLSLSAEPLFLAAVRAALAPRGRR